MTVRAWICRHRVAAFLIGAFVWSWAFWIPGVLAYLKVGEITTPLLFLALVGAYGPSLAALAVTGISGGRPAVKDLLKSLVAWRARPAWYAVTILLCSCVLLAAIAILDELPQADLSKLGSQILAIPLVLLTALPFGPLGEEMGWRGYLLPRMQERRSALGSSIIVGIVWAAWHAPLWWVPGAALPTWTAVGPASVGLWGARVVAVAVLFTWIYNNTGGSLFVAVLFHTMTNATGRIIMPLFAGHPDEFFVRIGFVEAVLYAAVAVAIVLLFGPKQLRRKPPIPQRP